jgi:hypothetical protein
MAREAIMTFVIGILDDFRHEYRDVAGRIDRGTAFGGIGAQPASGLGGHQGDPGAAAFDHPHPQVRPGRLI